MTGHQFYFIVVFYLSRQDQSIVCIFISNSPGVFMNVAMWEQCTLEN